MIILGIDPGFAIVGFGILESERGRQRLIRCGAITTPAAARRCSSRSIPWGRALSWTAWRSCWTIGRINLTL